MRFLLSFLLAVGLLLLAVVSQASAAGRGASELAPERFAGDVVRLADAGWTLGGIEVVEAEADVTVRLTLVAGDRGRALELVLELADGGQRPVAYRRARARVPAEARVFPGGAALFDGLRAAPVVGLSLECGGYALITGDDQVLGLDPDGWYVVRERARGATAARVFAAALAAPLAAGAHLAAVERVEGGLELRLAGEELSRSVVAELDARGTVLAVEVRESPRGYGEAHLPGEKALARVLGRAPLERVVVDDEVVRFELAGGRRFDLRADELVYPESEGCSC